MEIIARGYPKTSARRIAKVAGTLISMGPAIGPLARLFTRRMYAFMDDAPSWDANVTFTPDLTEELKFWLANINQLNGYKIKSMHAISKVVYTDASNSGYGGYVAQKLGNVIAHGKFNEFEAAQSSTYRELAAVKHVLHSLKQQLKHQIVLWHSDNMNVTQIINSGSSKHHLNQLAMEIYQTCLELDIQIISKWIPREEKALANSISKFHDTDAWSVDDETFAYVQKQFGLFFLYGFFLLEHGYM